jgi:uncharacterized protein (TIGR03067 family)
MRPLLSALFVTATVAAGAMAAGATPEGDLARLQGPWTTKAGPRRDILVVLEVQGHRARVRITLPHGPTLCVRGELTVDETAAPRALNWTKFVGLDGQDLPDIPAIYEVQGDTFRVCNGGPNGDRPTEFKPGDGVLADLLVFERPGPESRSSAPAPDRSSASATAARSAPPSRPD